MNHPTYFEKLYASLSRIARHSYYPGKDEAVALCLGEIDDLSDAGRISESEHLTLRELLLGEQEAFPRQVTIRDHDDSEAIPERSRIAILCEGPGSHAAFAAGVLAGVLEHSALSGQVVALGGSSLGAVSAILAWNGLIEGKPGLGRELLEGFWRDFSAGSLIDAMMNYSTQIVLHLRAIMPLASHGFQEFSILGRDSLRTMLESRINFARMAALAARDNAPRLVIGPVWRKGAVNLIRGPEIDAEAVLDAAIPHPDSAIAPAPWGSDGLMPEPRSLVRELREAVPTEIWVIQTRKTDRFWRTDWSGPILDSQKEAGDPWLEQELRLVRIINQLLQEGALIDDRYRVIEVHRIVMEHHLDDSSRLDRSPGLVGGLFSHGKERSAQFLERRGASVSASRQTSCSS